jgi:hypothetical protein
MKNMQKYIEMMSDLQKTYNINEAEVFLLIQLITLIKDLGWSRELAVKLLSAGAAMIDMIGPDKEDE